MSRFNDSTQSPKAPRLGGMPKFNDAEPEPKRDDWHDYYARAHGLTSREILDRDVRCYPEWPMGPYVRWIEGRWAEWHTTMKGRDITRNHYPVISREELTAFDAWLNATLPELDDDEEDED